MAGHGVGVAFGGALFTGASACKAQSSYTEKNEGRAERRPSSFSPTLVGTERT